MKCDSVSVISALSHSRYESAVAGANTYLSVSFRTAIAQRADSLREGSMVVDESGSGKADERDGVPARLLAII